MRTKRFWGTLALGLLIALAPASMARASCTADADSCGTQYQVSGATFNAGGQYACNPGDTMCANQSAGELAVGVTCKTGANHFCAQAGFDTSAPSLAILVNTPSVNVGVLKSDETHVGTATFSVESYLASGYQVTTDSPGPQNGSYAMSLMGTPGAGTAGTEGFGINLQQNSCPAAAPALPTTGGCTTSFGADPSQSPDSTFSFGYASTNYSTANNYYYHNGDIIAQSDTSSGETDYTISYLFNISGITPGGTYTMSQSLIATSTF